jgi:hypothetical protein
MLSGAPANNPFSVQQRTPVNPLIGRIASLCGARNPHVPGRTFRLLRAARLALHPEKRIFRRSQNTKETS